MFLLKQIAIEFLYYWWKIFRPRFKFQNVTYHYFCHRYNMTWRNERAIEIPIFWEIIKNNRAKKILEIGNVLPHYYDFIHDIVDKYESTTGVINQDIINFYPPRKYDLIISISTFEHIGWDEDQKESDKILKTIKHLKNNCLSPNGQIIFSAPLSYNQYLDNFIKNNQLGASKQYFFKRTSNFNDWQETDYNSVKNIKYASPYAFANAIIIDVIE